MPPTRGWGGVSPPAPLRAALLPVFLSLPFPSLLPFLFFHRRGGRRARQPLGCSEISRPPSTPAAQMQWITLMVLLFISSVEMLAQNRWKKQGRAHAERGYLVLPRCHPWVASGPQRGAGGGATGVTKPPGLLHPRRAPRGCFLHLCMERARLSPSGITCLVPTLSHLGWQGTGDSWWHGDQNHSPPGQGVGGGRRAQRCAGASAPCLGCKTSWEDARRCCPLPHPSPPSCCLGVPGPCRGARTRVPSVGWCHRSLGSAQCGTRAPFCNWCWSRDGIL